MDDKDILTNTTTDTTDYSIGGTSSAGSSSTGTSSADSSTETSSTETFSAESSSTETTFQSASSTADIYEKANEAATNPDSTVIESTTIYTAEDDSSSTFVTPQPATYTNTDSTYYSNTYSSTAEAPVSQTYGIISLVLGIFSILTCCCCGNLIFSIAGIILGCLQKPNSDGKKPGMAVAGIATSAVGILLTIIVYIFSFAFGAMDY